MVSSEDVSAREIGDLIKVDPAFSGQLLRMANSALFGLRGEVKTLIHAIVILGTDRVKAMAMFVALNNVVRSSVRADALRQVWLHSVVTAFLAEEAAKSAKLDRDAAYTSGLLHNLGALGMMATYPVEYCRMVDVTAEFGFDLLKTELDLFDIDHCVAGAYLAQDWNFPDELAAILATHHDDPRQADPGVDTVVKVAWRLAETLGYRAFPCEKDWTYEELVGLLPGRGDTWLKEGPETAQAELKRLLSVVPSF